MTHSDMIHALDRKYSGANAVTCPNEGQTFKMQCGQVRSEHGKMGVHATGTHLVCTCGTTAPTSSI